MSKSLIVNADDFGMSRGITDGIICAHRQGIVTSTSLMVSAPAAIYAARKVRLFPALTVGLHGVFILDRKGSVDTFIQQLDRQLSCYIKLMGTRPSHFDIHGVPLLTPAMKFAAHCFIAKYKINYRGNKGMTVINKFYGMKGKAPDVPAISTDALLSIIRELKEGLSVLVCHPGLTGNRLKDPYRLLRNRELRVLTSADIRSIIVNTQIRLVNFRMEVTRK